MKRILKHLSLLLVAVTLLAACGQGSGGNAETSTDNTPKNQAKKVVATTFIIADFAKTVGNDRIDVQTIPTSGQNIQNYQPSDDDIKAIQAADLILYTGEDLEPWMTKIIADLPESKYVEIGADIKRLTDKDFYHSEVTDNSYRSEDGSVNVSVKSSQTVSVKGGGQKDPYIYTDPLNAKKMLTAIEEGLIQMDSANAEVFKKNADTLRGELDRIDAEFRAVTETSDNKRLFLADTHTLRYLANAYKLNVYALEGNASAQDFEKEIKRVQPTTIFYISDANKARAETIAAEHGAKAVQFYDYLYTPADVSVLYLMEKNIESLKNGLF